MPTAKQELQLSLKKLGVEFPENATTAELQSIMNQYEANSDDEKKLPTPSQTQPQPEQPTKSESKVEETKEKSEIESLKAEIAGLKEMVRSVSDKARLSKFDATQPGEKAAKILHVSTYNGKIVVEWSKMTNNNVIERPGQKHAYNQTTELTYLDGSKEEVNYQMWQRDKAMVKGIVESETTKQDKTFYEVSTKDFGIFTIEETFIN